MNTTKTRQDLVVEERTKKIENEYRTVLNVITAILPLIYYTYNISVDFSSQNK